MTDESFRALERATERDPADLAARVAFFRARERAEGCAALVVWQRTPVALVNVLPGGGVYFDAPSHPVCLFLGALMVSFIFREGELWGLFRSDGRSSKILRRGEGSNFFTCPGGLVELRVHPSMGSVFLWAHDERPRINGRPHQWVGSRFVAFRADGLPDDFPRRCDGCGQMSTGTGGPAVDGGPCIACGGNGHARREPDA